MGGLGQEGRKSTWQDQEACRGKFRECRHGPDHNGPAHQTDQELALFSQVQTNHKKGGWLKKPICLDSH